MFRSLQGPGVATIVLSAAAFLMITMGTRQSLGLFVSPINTATELGIPAISFALALGQFAWGAIQPIAGACADRYGPGPVLRVALLVTVVACLVVPHMTSAFGMALTLGLLFSMGTGASSFSVLMGAAAQRLPLEARGTASGVINAGGSFGQAVFAPILQKIIQTFGWVGALWTMAIATLAAWPLINRVTGQRRDVGSARAQVSPVPEQTLRNAVATALRDRSYILLHLGFFTCGFHIAFLSTHLPGEVELCGLPPSVASWSLSLIGLANVAGSLYAGACIARYRSKYVLAAMYASRAVLIVWYLLMPKTEMVFYIFAIGLGFTWLATVPPTASIVGKLFGVRYLATLFGLTLLSHQIGGFLGAWLGGLAIYEFGDFTWMWYADIALALFAAVVNLPIREAPVQPRPAGA